MGRLGGCFGGQGAVELRRVGLSTARLGRVVVAGRVDVSNQGVNPSRPPCVVTRLSTGRGNSVGHTFRVVRRTGGTNTSTVGLRACARRAVAVSSSSRRFRVRNNL